MEEDTKNKWLQLLQTGQIDLYTFLKQIFNEKTKI
jgi:hypothetical protein